ncbi:MAG: SH3 domain-containing protein [Desulfococcaceae bacterium]
MKCIKSIVFSTSLMTALLFGPAVSAQQEASHRESSTSVTETDVPASQAAGKLKNPEIKDIPASNESESADTEGRNKAEAVSSEKSGIPKTGEEKKAESSAEKPDALKTGEEKKAESSAEKPDALKTGEEKKAESSAEKPDVPKTGEEKNTAVSSEKSDTPESKKDQDSPISPKTLSVQVKKANVRKDASLNAKINAQLKKGQAVTVTEVKDEWYHIQLDDGEHGWVHRSTLGEKTVRGKDIKPGDSISLTGNGNIRVSPDLTAGVLSVLKKGDTVVIKEHGEEWYHVQLADGRDGWAHKKLFAKRAPVRLHKMEGLRIEKSGKNEEKIYFLYKGPKPPDIAISKADSIRIICDFSNTRPGKGIEKKTEVKGNLIQAVRTGLHGEDQSDLRVVFDMVPGAEYELEHFFVKKELYLIIVKKQ